MREMKNVYEVWFGKREGKRPLGRHRHRWEGTIKTHIREIRCELDSSGSGQRPVACYEQAVNFLVP
jgi:hypothetical protein